MDKAMQANARAPPLEGVSQQYLTHLHLKLGVAEPDHRHAHDAPTMDAHISAAPETSR
jgi:hypothetical protein